MSLTHLSVTYISASAELLAVTFCRLDNQCNGPCKAIKWLEMDLVLKRTRERLLCGEGCDWS